MLILVCAVGFNIVNGLALGGWLGGYGDAGGVGGGQVLVGAGIWALGLGGNVWHEEILRRARKGEGEAGKGKVVRVGGREYRLPKGGGFAVCWYPHVSCFLSG